MSTRRKQNKAGQPSQGASATPSQAFQPHTDAHWARLAPGEAAALVAAAADIALIVDPDGVVEDGSASVDGLPGGVPQAWVGRPWVDVVTPESRHKIESLLQPRPAASTDAPWRHVNHPVGPGADFPVMYRALPMGEAGRILAMGRDMRSVAGLQQRLVDAQHAVDRDFLRLRTVESLYRLLFERASEAILIVEARDHRVVEANAMAVELLGTGSRRLVGQPLGTGWPERFQRELQGLLGRVQASGKAEDLRLRATTPRRLDGAVSASLFKQDERPMFLVRLRPQDSGLDGGQARADLNLSQLVQSLPDGFVVTTPEGEVITANTAFVELAQMTREEHLVGEPIGRWLGRPGVDVQVMLAALRQQGSLRLFNTVVHGEHGVDAEVEVSAVSVTDASPPCLGFSVRHVGRRLAGTGASAERGSLRSVEQLTQLVGRMPLKDLVRESTDLIEQLCIEAALQLTQGNRAAAAEMLGLSRQSLYVKLRRYGMASANGEAADT